MADKKAAVKKVEEEKKADGSGNGNGNGSGAVIEEKKDEPPIPSPSNPWFPFFGYAKLSIHKYTYTYIHTYIQYIYCRHLIFYIFYLIFQEEEDSGRG